MCVDWGRISDVACLAFIALEVVVQLCSRCVSGDLAGLSEKALVVRVCLGRSWAGCTSLAGFNGRWWDVGCGSKVCIGFLACIPRDVCVG